MRSRVGYGSNVSDMRCASGQLKNKTESNRQSTQQTTDIQTDKQTRQHTTIITIRSLERAKRERAKFQKYDSKLEL